jgi:DNA-binding Lrp family transcriptional regulator
VKGEAGKKLPSAFLLLNTEIGAENQVLKALQKIEGVEEAHNLWGVYDIIANVRANTVEELKFIITERIERVGKINSKLAMIVTDKPQPKLEDRLFFEESPMTM